jgi:hypothetical protein
MSEEKTQSLDTRTQAALRELQGILTQHYPEATFHVTRSQDDPESIHLVTTVDVEDTDAVLDVVIERVLKLQVEAGLAVHVIPVRPIARVLALRQQAKQTAQQKGFQAPPL